ncbi:putative merlin/moesin/ezrin/radixin [Fasciola hepatica]|uniref:Merlin/moesin/ezrin/radixin n=1 Tax=Fasciola hepatica TaxID=6192 RepID=A0A4E0RBC1_FASHE|nr:putative merlin/moesin/ezrin/radixin [Fasciola hepatica]
MGVKWFPVRVTTPESVLEFKLKQNSSGRQLFNQVCNTIGLREVWWFGLRYVDSKGVEKWVKLNKKISPSSKSKDACTDFTFRVKFFPEEVSEELIQDVTQRLFYYEVKSSVVSGQYYTSPDSALLLASYQALVRHGKYDPEVHKTGFINIPNYIPAQLTPKISFPWNEIRKLVYSHSKFTVKPTDTSGKDIVFYCDSTSACKEVMALCTGNHELYGRRRRPDSIEVQQMKAQAKEAKDARKMEQEKLAAERRARELMEERYRKMELAMQEQEMAYEMSRSALTDYQRKVEELESQLEEEKRARMELESMQRRLEEVNRQLELETAASLEDRCRLKAERDRVLNEIDEQKRIINEKEQEKRTIEAALAKARAERDDHSNGVKNRDSGEQELQPLDNLCRPEDSRQTMAAMDMDHAKRLEMIRKDLNPVRDQRKLQKVDIQYEANVSKGMDKYRTLNAIRQGNTKKRVEQFESL